MTYCIKFTILYKDCLVMKKIGNWPITEADTNFSKLQKMDQKIGNHWHPLLLLLVVVLLFSRPESLI